jgi:hypothetical protein
MRRRGHRARRVLTTKRQKSTARNGFGREKGRGIHSCPRWNISACEALFVRAVFRLLRSIKSHAHCGKLKFELQTASTEPTLNSDADTSGHSPSPMPKASQKVAGALRERSDRYPR